MAAIAHVIHRMTGRARLRVPSQKGHPEYFDALERGLLESAAVDAVVTNAVTASAVVHHRGELDAVLRHAEERGLFRLEPLEPESDAALIRIHDRIGALDEALKERNGDAWGLGSLSFYGLLGASAWQLHRGKFLPAGGTLLIQALKVLVHAAESETRRRSGPP